MHAQFSQWYDERVCLDPSPLQRQLRYAAWQNFGILPGGQETPRWSVIHGLSAHEYVGQNDTCSGVMAREQQGSGRESSNTHSSGVGQLIDVDARFANSVMYLCCRPAGSGRLGDSHGPRRSCTQLPGVLRDQDGSRFRSMSGDSHSVQGLVEPRTSIPARPQNICSCIV